MSFKDLSMSLDRMKESFLLASALGGNTRDCESLLDIGAQVNYQSNNGDTPLLVACKRGHIETIHLLLRYGADANICGDDSMNSLHVCASLGNAYALKILLDLSENVNINSKTNDGLTAYDIALANRFDDVCLLLLQYMESDSSTNNRVITSDRSRNSSSSSLTISNLAQLHEVSRSEVNQYSRPSLSPRLDSLILTPLTQKEPAQTQSKNVMKEPMHLHNIHDCTGAVPDRTEKYEIIGPSSIHDKEELSFLRKAYDQEKKQRAMLELKVQSMTQQTERLTTEIYELNKSLRQISNELAKKSADILLYKGDKAAINTLSLPHCKQLDQELRVVLSEISKRKEYLISEALQSQAEQRLCVICAEREKTVVLLPCRHLCLCDVCSSYDSMVNCPLCRKDIDHKISVYS